MVLLSSGLHGGLVLLYRGLHGGLVSLYRGLNGGLVSLYRGLHTRQVLIQCGLKSGTLLYLTVMLSFPPSRSNPYWYWYDRGPDSVEPQWICDGSSWFTEGSWTRQGCQCCTILWPIWRGESLCRLIYRNYYIVTTPGKKFVFMYIGITLSFHLNVWLAQLLLYGWTNSDESLHSCSTRPEDVH